MSIIGRIVNRLGGSGPWRVSPFERIAAEITDDCRWGVHRPERFAGTIRSIADDPVFYKEAVSLLKQERIDEIIDGEPRYLGGGQVPGQIKCLMTMSDAGIVGSDGVVYCPRARSAILETVRNWTAPGIRHPVLGAVGFPKAIPLHGLSISLASQSADGFYHHLCESLPRLWIARDMLSNADHVLVSGERNSIREAWFAAAGVPVAKLRWLGGVAHFRCQQLLFTNHPMRDNEPTYYIQKCLIELFESSLGVKRRGRMIWVSRADAKARHLEWEDKLLLAIPSFEKVVLTTLRPLEQVQLFAEASVVAGPHGAGLANILFCSPGAKLIELFPDHQKRPLFSRIACVANAQAAWASVDFRNCDRLGNLAEAMKAFLQQ